VTPPPPPPPPPLPEYPRAPALPHIAPRVRGLGGRGMWAGGALTRRRPMGVRLPLSSPPPGRGRPSAAACPSTCREHHTTPWCTSVSLTACSPAARSQREQRLSEEGARTFHATSHARRRWRGADGLSDSETTRGQSAGWLGPSGARCGPLACPSSQSRDASSSRSAHFPHSLPSSAACGGSECARISASESTRAATPTCHAAPVTAFIALCGRCVGRNGQARARAALLPGAAGGGAPRA